MSDIPENITIEVTRFCNLRCSFCFYRQNDRNLPDIPAETIGAIIEEADNLGVKSVRFTGGEPLMREDIEELLLDARNRGFYVILNTNATLINTDRIRKIEQLVDNVLISLPSFNRTTEKETTGRDDLFDLKLKNIHRLLNSPIPYVRVGTPISRALIENFQKYWKIIKSLNIRRWEFYRPILTKGQTKKSSPYNISAEELIKVMEICRLLQNAGVYAYIPNAVPFCISKDEDLNARVLKGGRFDDGRDRLVWDSRGFFKPSYYIDINLGKTIESALDNQWLKQVKKEKWLPAECKKCKWLKWCRGGSRFAAREYNGDYFARDPWAFKNCD